MPLGNPNLAKNLQFFMLSAFLKKFSQKTSYSIFDKPFTPILQLSKFIATKTGSAIKYSFAILLAYCKIAHMVSCLIQLTYNNLKLSFRAC
jgi:hypothetical protein